MLTTNQKGLVAETAIVHECVKLGIGVARPLDDAPYDLILDLGPKLLRVQCKWAVRQGGVVVIRTGRCGAAERGTSSTGHTDRTRSMQSRPTVWIQAVVTFCRTSSPSTDRWCSCASHPPRTTRWRA